MWTIVSRPSFKNNNLTCPLELSKIAKFYKPNAVKCHLKIFFRYFGPLKTLPWKTTLICMYCLDVLNIKCIIYYMLHIHLYNMSLVLLLLVWHTGQSTTVVVNPPMVRPGPVDMLNTDDPTPTLCFNCGNPVTSYIYFQSGTCTYVSCVCLALIG